jgi:hypothetical protein
VVWDLTFAIGTRGDTEANVKSTTLTDLADRSLVPEQEARTIRNGKPE